MIIQVEMPLLIDDFSISKNPRHGFVMTLSYWVEFLPFRICSHCKYVLCYIQNCAVQHFDALDNFVIMEFCSVHLLPLCTYLWVGLMPFLKTYAYLSPTWDTNLLGLSKFSLTATCWGVCMFSGSVWVMFFKHGIRVRWLQTAFKPMLPHSCSQTVSNNYDHYTWKIAGHFPNFWVLIGSFTVKFLRITNIPWWSYESELSIVDMFESKRPFCSNKNQLCIPEVKMIL